MYTKENCKKLKSYIDDIRLQKAREERKRSIAIMRKKLKGLSAEKYRKLFG